MDSGTPTFDFSDTEVYFSSCDARVPFQNPSDAAIAHLSVQMGVTLSAVQAVLDLIVSNPSFNSREVTFKSAGIIDEVVAEHREMRVLQRVSAGDKEMESGNSAKSPLAISLVISQIDQEIQAMPVVSLLQFIVPWERYDPDYMLLKNMSLVYRSWTMPAQERLFKYQRMPVKGTLRSDLVRPLLHHPLCSSIRELDVAVWCMSDDDLDRFALLLRRLPSLRRLSLDVSDVDLHGLSLAHHDDICAKIYSEIASRLPNLAELRVKHTKIEHLEDCAKCILQTGSGPAPFVVKNLSLFEDYDDGFRSEILLSRAQLYPIVHQGTFHYPFTYSNPQVPNSRNTSKCSITIESRDNQQMTHLFDTGGVFRSVLPEISHLTLYLWSATDISSFSSFLASFLGKCTSMAHMILFITQYEDTDKEMSVVPFSCISESLRVLCIYFRFPVDADAQRRTSGLEHVVRTMRDREAGSSLERIEVTFYRNPFLDRWSGTIQPRIEISPPKYLDSVHRMCRKLDIDLVYKIVDERSDDEIYPLVDWELYLRPSPSASS